MRSLNREQARGLANFFFDVAKGLILGGIGFAAATPVSVRLLLIVMVVILAYACVRFALSILEQVE